MDLCDAVASNDLDHVQDFVEDRGADINKVSRSGFAPLCVAAFWGADHILSYLLECKADVNVQNHGTKWTPLHCAAFQTHGKCIMLLLKHKPDIHKLDAQGRCAADFASVADNIWGFFANLGCKRTPKSELISKGVIQKQLKPHIEGAGGGEAGGGGTPHLAALSRPGSAYVLSYQPAALSRPATGSRPNSSASSRRGSKQLAAEEAEELKRDLGKLSLDQQQEAHFNAAKQFGDVLSGHTLPSPVAEGSDEGTTPVASNARGGF
mmetsp:Transcript_31461/g.61355  ORF Transcript_31461/g.61355 Transcript_31461/m.61355 type:complete len:265 (+) Transcript_31461:14-808(+)